MESRKGFFISDTLLPNKKKRCTLYFLLLFCFFACQSNRNSDEASLDKANSFIKPINEAEIGSGENTKAILGAGLIDGSGGPLLENATVLVDRNKIIAVGAEDQVNIPEGAEIYNANGKYLIPGLVDAHFHLDRLDGLPHQFLMNGITSLRDPGAWIEAYDNERASLASIPRLFLTGPHFDMYPPAHPGNAIIVRDEEEARRQVNRMADQGASAIKIYYRLGLGTMKAICEEAHKRGLPVTAHLEIHDVTDVINAGVDGIEHVTSVGLALIPFREAEEYRQKVLLDNDARREGRYEMWAGMDFSDSKADSLIHLMVEKEIYFCPTLAVFERKDQDADEIRYAGFNKMMEFTAMAHEAGVKVVVGSHSYVPFADLGWAYHRELELFAECNISNADIIKAATILNARFLKVEDQLGTIEIGKTADLILLDENPLDDIQNMRKIHKVMLNGKWMDPFIP